MHVNRKDVNHNLTNNNVNGDQQHKCDTKSVVSFKVFDCFFGQKDGLLIDDETIHEHHASSQKSISLKEKPVLVVTQDVIAHLSKQNIC